MIVLPASDPRAIRPMTNTERRRIWRWRYDSLPLEQQIGAETSNTQADESAVTQEKEH